MWRSKTVSIIFPAHNEKENIFPAVKEFAATGVADEILVVDNNSTDGTGDEARKAGARVVEESRPGYGSALIRGLREARGDIVIMAEPDGTFVSHDVFKLLAYEADFDMVCGTRTTREFIWQEANMGWFLRFGNIVVAKLLEVLFGAPSLSDCGCTLRLVHRNALDGILPHLSVSSSHFLPQMVMICLLKGFSLIEIPVNYRGRIGTSKITGTFSGAFKTGAKMISLILRTRLKHLS